MKHESGTFRGVGGYDIFYQSWHPDVTPLSCLAIVHGFGEHGGRYMNLVNPLVFRGHSVYALDQRGYGRSPGQRGHIAEWREPRGDLSAFLQMINEQCNCDALFLYGHSMGGLVVLDQLQICRPKVCGAILSGVVLLPLGFAKPYRVTLARIVSKIRPRFSADVGLDITAISRDPAVVQAYATDPFVHGSMSARAAAEFADMLPSLRAHAQEMKTPALLIHGEKDRLSDAQGSRWLFETLQASDKQLIVYPGGYHEPHNDIDHMRVANDIAAWMEERRHGCSRNQYV